VWWLLFHSIILFLSFLICGEKSKGPPACIISSLPIDPLFFLYLGDPVSSMIFSPWRLSLFVLQFFPLDLMLYLCQASIIMCQSVGLFFLLPQEFDEKGTQGERESARANERDGGYCGPLLLG
jgi:hypothetical protein